MTIPSMDKLSLRSLKNLLLPKASASFVSVENCFIKNPYLKEYFPGFRHPDDDFNTKYDLFDSGSYLKTIVRKESHIEVEFFGEVYQVVIISYGTWSYEIRVFKDEELKVFRIYFLEKTIFHENTENRLLFLIFLCLVEEYGGT